MARNCGVALAVAVQLAVVSIPGTLHAQQPATHVFTRRQAIDSALAANPQLRVAHEQLEQARARGVENTAFPDPTVTGAVTSVDVVPQVNSNTISTLGLGLTVPFPTKFIVRHKQSSADIASAQFTVSQQQQQIAAQTSQAYDALLVAERHRADLQDADSLAVDFMTKTQARYEAGSAPKLDVIKAQVDRAQAATALLANYRDMANAVAGVNRLLGRSLGAPLSLADTLSVPPTPAAVDSLIATARARRPELSVLSSQRVSAGEAATLAQQYWLPDLDFTYVKNVAEGLPSSYTTALQITFPLFFWNHQRGEVREARHHEDELAASYRDLEAQVDQEVRTAYGNMTTALQQVVYLHDGVVPEAREAYEIARISYGLGGSSALDVLDARRTLLDAESQYADALGAANDARADLDRAIGVPIDELGGNDAR